MALGFLTPPKIPEPVKPDDFTASERERLRGVINDGDPLKERRDQTAIDRLLTNSVTEITGPTGAFTLAQRQHADDNVSKNIAEFLGQSAQLEDQRRFEAEGRLGELESDRKRDLDEYEQLQASHQAAEEVARKNWQSGLLRAGVNLAGTAIGAPGVGSLLFPGNEEVPEGRQANIGLGSMYTQDSNRFTGRAMDRLPAPGFEDVFGTPTDSSRLPFLGY